MQAPFPASTQRDNENVGHSALTTTCATERICPIKAKTRQCR
eukprot:CAMPEP_0204581120 /NCGR_PEP_ID=MMETSP0661-20131031/44452_1 /ASSEMBLY_ACC=CAM_ASM_000606 /TAXON_ID=109239 /ORGANISM="Alexandrium margalefi, Strain AMGDE01CS-322" /LENGTH=41 /DNA_ID= /DNA_START= /DNA_END= /DNA_ORIENTATION=